MARGRPNWWVILAVSLGLMALLVATAGAPRGRRNRRAARPRRPPAIRRGPGLLWSADADSDAGHADHHDDPTTTTTTTTTTAIGRGRDSRRRCDARHVGRRRRRRLTAVPAPVRRPPRRPRPRPTTTTTGASAAVPADRTQTQGYLNPPTEPSNKFGFTGTGAMEVSVVWSGTTYLTMQVSCPTGARA